MVLDRIVGVGFDFRRSMLGFFRDELSSIGKQLGFARAKGVRRNWLCELI